MAPKLYMIDLSPPARAVMLTEKAIGIKLDHVNVDLLAKEQMKPDFLKMNPQHTIPTLVDDDGTIIWDSHAIICYLVDKYAKDDKLYPKNLAKRAKIAQRLYFDAECLFAVVRRMVKPIMEKKSKTPDAVSVDQIVSAYDFCDKFLEGQDWMAGSDVTVADFSLISTITSINIIIPVDPKFKNLTAWIKRCQALPYYSANSEGLKSFEGYYKFLTSQ